MKNLEITKIFNLIESNPDSLNGEGKKDLICEAVYKMPEEHLDWLMKILRDRYYLENIQLN